jgi:uncharacterized protein (DUF433 family)
MSVPMPPAIAGRIASRANREGWAEVFGRKVRTSDVLAAWRDGTHEYESFASFVLTEADEYGVTP